MRAETSKDGDQENGGVPRRTLLGWLVGLINVGVFAAVLGPTLGFVGSPLKRGKKPGVWIPVIDDAELADGQTRSVDFKLDVEDGYMMANRTYSVYLYRKGSRVVAFDPSCPHLGCHVEFKARKNRYVCPCHGGTFGADGNRISGPPPRGLTRVATKIEAGKIWVYRV